MADVAPISDADADDAAVGFAVDVVGAVLRVAFRGELDLACAELFDCLFDLEIDGIDSVVLDLAALTFCDVSGANALAGLRAFHRCQGRACWFSAVQPQVRRVMTLTEQHAPRARDGAAPA